MQTKVPQRAARSGAVLLLALAMFGQEFQKPRIASIKGIPSEPISPGTCTSSTFGYLELNGKTAGFTEAELGRMILPALRDGYVLTIYPPTKRGIFVNQECHAIQKPTVP
jgi:hypothetical protein